MRGRFHGLLVGQVFNLRPIFNRPRTGGLNTRRRLKTCPIILALAALALAAAVVSGASPSLPEGPGRKILESACVACHSLDVVTAKRWSNQQWRDSVNAMIARGAAVNKDQARDLVTYLGRHFGNRGRELFEDICSSCHALERVEKQALSKEQWSTFIKGMISEGNPVNDEEFALLVDYLAEHFGDNQ